MCSWDCSFRSFPFLSQLEDRLQQMFSEHHMTAQTCLCDTQVTHPFLTNAFILTSIYFHDSCKINITSGISAHRTESDKSKIQLLKAGVIPRSLPVKGEPLPNDMISLNPLFVPQAVESTRVFHSVVMTGLFADERVQRPVKPATHRLVWVIRSWETEWRRRMMGSQTDDRHLWIFFNVPGLFLYKL